MFRAIFLSVCMVLLLQAKDDDYIYNTDSLVAFESGYSFFDSNSDANVGLKIGAQTNNYRVYLNANEIQVSKSIDQALFGTQIEYMFNFSKIASFYVGADLGYAKRSDKTDYNSYIGAEAGFDFHIDKRFDIQAGARSIKVKDLDTTNSAFMAVVIKYDMD